MIRLVIRWIVIVGLFLIALIVPIGWLGSPRDALALGLLIGGLSVIGLDELLKD